ncbi:4-amino-4-deoxy-L-arabinose-phosphoundecaprenol flippase subunit ArnF [uncultured archaeon]|nr:4-amino-4-deoxy-L-arabinose-phosphoundecaprenol flippase subunit ArnF [uncultured archaeon]
MQVEKAMFALTLVLICVLAGAAGQIFWKEGMSNLGRINGIGDLLQVKTVWDIFTNKYIILGIFLYAISVFLWLGAMSTLDISFMYPLLSLGYIVTAILAFVFLSENITLLRWAGIVVIIAGCFMITKS